MAHTPAAPPPGFQPIEVPVRDQTEGFEPIEVTPIDQLLAAQPSGPTAPKQKQER